MCRFKFRDKIVTFKENIVSIHPMCRFKKLLVKCQRKAYYVSIHPMCRFKLALSISSSALLSFQYILCVGSSDIFNLLKGGLIEFQYILCVGSRLVVL